MTNLGLGGDYHSEVERDWLRSCVWWKKGIIYQVYPRSFQDSNGDGVGDLRGIIQRLDYLQSLHVAAIWVSPIYPSPMKDFGYDVSDYRDIHPLFGSMSDFEELLEEVHVRGMRLMLDLVPNHTSDEHPLFQRSRSEGREGAFRDWYIWRDPKLDEKGERHPPNNWRSFFGGPAWTFDEASGQYYLHQFLTSQPELNYRNPQVLEYMLETMRFWLRKGVDGFRVDVIWLLMKDLELRDEPLNDDWDGVNPFEQLKHIHSQNVEGIHDIIRKMRSVMDEFPEKLMVGEIYLPYQELMKYVGEELDECHLPFNFKLISIQWNASVVRHFVNDYEKMLPPGSWPNWVLGNHDQPRVAARIGSTQARVANMMLLTLRGTPTTFYGEEIGMMKGEVPFEEMKDPQGLNNPEVCDVLSRDFQRTPMQWSDEPNAGFSEPGIKTWLPVTSNYRTLNVKSQEADPNSPLSLYRALSFLRKKEPSLSIGHYRCVVLDDPQLDEHLFCYLRQAHHDESNHQISKRRVPRNSEECSDEDSDDEECQSFARKFACYPDGFLIILNFSSNVFTLNLYQKHLKGLIATTSLSEDTQLEPIAQLEVSTSYPVSRDAESPVDLRRLRVGADEGLLIRLRQVARSEE